MEKPLFLVCGATGNQGGAVVDALLSQGQFRLRALVRNPERAQSLAARGVELVRGDLTDLESLKAATKDVAAVFGVTQPWSADYRKADVGLELRQGKNLVDACVATGATLILSTVLLMDEKPTTIPHVDSKLELEQYARAKKGPLVILGPASFLDNIGMNFFPVKKGKVRGFVDADAKVPYICCADIGRAVAGVAANLPAHVGKRYNLMAGAWSGLDICNALSSLRGGEKFRYSAIPKLMMRLFAKEFWKMRNAFEMMGRPPYPPLYTDAVNDTKSLVGTPTDLTALLKQKGFAEKVLG